MFADKQSDSFVSLVAFMKGALLMKRLSALITVIVLITLALVSESWSTLTAAGSAVSDPSGAAPGQLIFE